MKIIYKHEIRDWRLWLQVEATVPSTGIVWHYAYEFAILGGQSPTLLMIRRTFRNLRHALKEKINYENSHNNK